MSNKTDKKPEDKETQLVNELCASLVLTETKAKGGKTPIAYYSIPSKDIELVGDLADERGKHEEYQERVAMAYNVLLKTAQTVQSDEGRGDTLSEEEKLKRARVLITERWFLVTESEATKTKRQMTDVKAIVEKLATATKAGNAEDIASLNAQLVALMGQHTRGGVKASPLPIVAKNFSTTIQSGYTPNDARLRTITLSEKMTSQTFCLEDAKRPVQNTQYMA